MMSKKKRKKTNNSKRRVQTKKLNPWISIGKWALDHIITLIITIVGGLLVALVINFIQSNTVENNRTAYFNQLNEAFLDAVNVDANEKLQNLLYETNKEEYQDIHDYWLSMSKHKNHDIDGANNLFAQIDADSSLFPASIYSRVQCELELAENDYDVAKRLYRLIRHCEENNRGMSPENLMLKALYYRVDLDYEGITETVDNFINTSYYTNYIGHIFMGKNESINIEDYHTYNTVYTALLVTMIYSAYQNQIYDDIDWIEEEFEKWNLSHVRRFEYNPYFSCGGSMIKDTYFIPHTLDLASEFDIELQELEGEGEFTIINDNSIADIKYGQYKFK